MKLCIKIIRNEQGGYTAVCPLLPGCETRGQTCEDAKKRMDEAVKGYMAAMNNFVPDVVQQEFLEV